MRAQHNTSACRVQLTFLPLLQPQQYIYALNKNISSRKKILLCLNASDFMHIRQYSLNELFCSILQKLLCILTHPVY